MDSSVPGANNLTKLLNKRLLVVLRDGKKLLGFLESYDQFGSLVLSSCYQRHYHNLEWTQTNLGTLMIRGENIVLVGELDEQEWKSCERRMGRFRREGLDFLKKTEAERMKDVDLRRAQYELGASDMAEYDFY